MGENRGRRLHANKAIAFFAQDSWRINPRLTLNFGVRYDVEITPLFEASTDLNAALEPALGVVEGIPRDKNNFAPRLALAWDPTGSGNTVIRAGYGIFYDHPLLGIAFNSFTAEGALSTQLIAPPGSPTRASVVTDPTGAMNAASIFQGVLNATPNMGFLPNEQRFDAKLQDSLFTNQNFMTLGFPFPFLPLTLPVSRDFEYGYAQQADFTIERKLGKNYRISASYNFTRSLHLYRPRNINAPHPLLLSRNFRNALAAGLTPSNPLSVAVPSTDVAPTAGTCGISVAPPPLAPGALGVLSGCPAPLAALDGQFLSNPAFFNYFRPSGPNPSFAEKAGGYANLVALAGLAGYPTGFPGIQVPWGDAVQQESSGRSDYHGLTVSLSKRFSTNFEFLSSYTWSHAIDDSTDLQTLLAPQDNRNAGLERGNSTFDQRHRWVFSAIFQSPTEWRGSAGAKKIFADFVVAPIVEVSSGRPYSVLTGTDFNLDLGSNTDRPSVATSGGVSSPFITDGTTFTIPTVCDEAITLGAASLSPPFGCTGNLGRNTFTRPGFAQVDLRVSRKLELTERWNLDFIMDVFNLFNRFNVGDVNPLCNPLDPRQLQFALKLNW